MPGFESLRSSCQTFLAIFPRRASEIEAATIRAARPGSRVGSGDAPERTKIRDIGFAPPRPERAPCWTASMRTISGSHFLHALAFSFAQIICNPVVVGLLPDRRVRPGATGLGESRGNWQTADRSSARPVAAAVPPSRSSRPGLRCAHGSMEGDIRHPHLDRRQGAECFDVHARYDYTAWGEPDSHQRIRRRCTVVWRRPETIAAVDGPEASRLIPKSGTSSRTTSFAALGDYNAWPGPNSNTFVQAVLDAVPELEDRVAADRHWKGLPLSRRVVRDDPVQVPGHTLPQEVISVLPSDGSKVWKSISWARWWASTFAGLR